MKRTPEKVCIWCEAVSSNLRPKLCGGDLVQNARSSQSIKTIHGFANVPCTVVIISEELAFWTRSRPHNFASFFSEIAKLLHPALFLNTAAMCYLYVGMVLRSNAGGSHNKIVMVRISQNFILPIMSPIVTFRSSPYFILSIMSLIVTFWSSPLNNKWTMYGSMVMTVMAWEDQHHTSVHICKQLSESAVFFLTPSNCKCYSNICSSTLTIGRMMDC
jgi:hypothetical protein